MEGLGVPILLLARYRASPILWRSCELSERLDWSSYRVDPCDLRPYNKMAR
jgi:hypothetical protein